MGKGGTNENDQFEIERLGNQLMKDNGLHFIIDDMNRIEVRSNQKRQKLR